MKLIARLAGVAVAGVALAGLVEGLRPQSRGAQAALLVLSIAIGGFASEQLLKRLRR